MAPPCSVCAHGLQADIDRAITAGEALKSIAGRHGLSASSLARHRDRHVSRALAPVEVVDAVPVGDGVVDRVEALVRRAERIMAAAEAEASTAKALAAMAECRRLLELVAKLRGELDDRPQVAVINLQQAPEWIEVRTKLMRALAPFPAARVAVAEALA